MLKIKELFSIIFILGISYWVISSFFNAIQPEPQPEDTRYNAIFRIVQINPYTGNPITTCSGFVLSDKIALTAFHCMGSNKVTYMDQYKTEGMDAYLLGYNKIMDFAVLQGDFRKYKKLKYKIPMNGIEGNKGPFKTYGYALRGKLLSFDYKPKGVYQFFIAGEGHVYPAMSGGPLIDESTGEAVGINVSAGSQIYVSPLVNTLEDVGIVPEE